MIDKIKMYFFAFVVNRIFYRSLQYNKYFLCIHDEIYGKMKKKNTEYLMSKINPESEKDEDF